MAPYEADAQISFLMKEGHVDFAISEDSDLLAFGCAKVCQFGFTCKLKYVLGHSIDG